MARSASFSAVAWQRLKKNRGAVFGLVIILLASLAAIFAYYIAPDHSPFANRIVLEIGGRKPGFTQSFISVKKEKQVQQVNAWQHLLNGQEEANYYVPIEGHSEQGDSVIVQKFIDEGL